jgi:hypothetical protein
MYIRQHDGKHMTGDRMKILMLNLPLLMRDLLRPEVRYIDIILTYCISATISYSISYCILGTIVGTIFGMMNRI